MEAVMTEQVQRWQELARQLRIDSIRCSTEAGSGHPTSSLSAADLMAVLLAAHLRYDFDHPRNPANDHLIFSKGHASPLLYALFKAAGAISDAELLTFRKFGSRLQGHPTPALPWVEVATGSLGQGLPIGVGLALAGKYLDRLPYRVWVLVGDSETSEGSVWEAFALAGHYRLDNLIAIIDVNRLGQRGPTMLGWDTATYARRARAFGWEATEIDGHDLARIDAAYRWAEETSGAPKVIIARTVKGKGVPFLEDKPGWHGKPLSREEAQRALTELGESPRLTVRPQPPEPVTVTPRPAGPLSLPVYPVGSELATRVAYGEALAALGAARPNVVALDAEVSNSTYSEKFQAAHPDRFFEMFIAEQQMIAAAVGLQVRGYVPFASTFGAFLTRAYDFVRMAAISDANLCLVGSHAGVSIGEDGPSQMALEDLAMFRAVHGSTVLHPCDANQTARLVATMADLPGIVYLRTLRNKTPVIYPPGENFPVGGSRVLHRSEADQVTIVAAGATVPEALAAYMALRAEGINARVIDAYSIKPIDAETLRQAARETGRIVTVEDHWPEGGLGDAVLEAFSGWDGPLPRVVKLGVREMPGSGTPEELREAAGISARHIVTAARTLVTGAVPAAGA
jgi:transketolase